MITRKTFLIHIFIMLSLLPACTGNQHGTPVAASEPRPISPTEVSNSQADEITVAAAADLQFAFSEIAEKFKQETGHSVTLVFGSTGQLAQQIENGAPYDLVAAADRSYVDRLASEGLVAPNTIALYARGRIVIAVNQKVGVTVTNLSDLASSQIKHIAIANPAHAPYGVAAKQALQASGLWDQVQSKLVYGENIRQTLQFIQTGDAEAGIIALSVANVPEITWTLIPNELHAPLDQALAVTSSSKRSELASQFAAYINGPTGRPIMGKFGFVLPGESITVGDLKATPLPTTEP